MPPKGAWAMYGLLSGQNMMNQAIRSGLPTAIPFLARQAGLNAAESSKLLAAFFPGYVLTQIPGGILAQHIGGKAVVFLNLLGNGLFLMAAPLASTLGKYLGGQVNAVALAFLCAGLCQGPLVPVQVNGFSVAGSCGVFHSYCRLDVVSSAAFVG